MPLGAPPHVYKGGREEKAGQEEARHKGGVQLGLLVQVGFPSFQFLVGEGGKDEEERRKGGLPPKP